MKIKLTGLLLLLMLGITGADAENSPIGYELLDEGRVVHVWNTQDDYFFNKSSGIQFTNHYEDYWTRNIFCLGYYSGETWNKIKCADELSTFNKDIRTDNATFVNATLWKDISYEGYDMRFGVQYHLGVDDKNLSITIYGKNIGIDIPFDLGFAWKVTDWDIPTAEAEDYLLVDNKGYIIKAEHDLMFKNMDEPYFMGRDSTYAFGGEFLRVDWKETLDYAVKMYGNGSRESFYVALLINAGHFNPQQEKQTTFKWIDAIVLGTNAGFVEVSPTVNPSGTNEGTDGWAHAAKDQAPIGAIAVTEIGVYIDGSTEAADITLGLYTDDGGTTPGDLLGSVTIPKGTSAGWKKGDVDIAITPGEWYWIASQVDETDTLTNLNTNFAAGYRRAVKFDQTTLTDPWGESVVENDDYLSSIFALVSYTPPPIWNNNQTNATCGSVEFKANWSSMPTPMDSYNLVWCNGQYEETDNTCETGGGATLNYYDSFEDNFTYYWEDDAVIYAWGRDRLGTPSSGTGPQPQGSALGALGTTWYIFVETSSGSCYTAGQTALVYQSPDINWDSQGDERIVWYANMYGADMGELSLAENSTGSWVDLWNLSGTQGTPWFRNEVNLTALTNIGNLRFYYECDGGYRGDIALDEIHITNAEDSTDHWITEDWAPFSRANWSNYTKSVNTTVGVKIGWNQTANDTTSNQNTTDHGWFTTTDCGGAPPAANSTCDNYTTTGVIDCSDLCNVSINGDMTGNNLSFVSTGRIDILANITNIDILFKEAACTIVGYENNRFSGS